MVAPSNQALLTQWHWEPSILLGLALLAAAYMYAVGPLRRRYGWGPPVRTSQIAYFICSLAILFFALLSPLDTVGDRYLFSAHMIQHLLLATLWPALLLLAIPSWLAAVLLRRRTVSGIWSFLTYPAVALLLFNFDIYLWHLPALYDATLKYEGVHILEHVTFMAVGVINWWPILSPIQSQRLSYPMQLLYLLADGMIMMALGIVFTFAPTPFYDPYTTAPRLWGISAATDQQIGGLIMWYPGNLPYAVLIVVAFFRWFDAGGSTSKSPKTRPQSPTIGPPVSR